MAKQPVVSGAEAVKAFQRAGWRIDRLRVRSPPLESLSQGFA
jgi:hypothetical protein